MIEIPTIVINCKHLIERKKCVESQLQKNIKDYTFYLDYDKDDLNEDIINSYYSDDHESQQLKLELWKPEIHKSRRLNNAEISLTIKHFEILKIISESNHRQALVLEDDVILCHDFIVKFDDYLNRTPQDYDMIFLGAGAGLRPPHINTIDVAYLKSHPASKCTDSYVITREASKKLVSSFLPFNLCVDFEMAYHMYKHDLKVYWWEPPLVAQGSETGLFKSELR